MNENEIQSHTLYANSKRHTRENGYGLLNIFL